MRQGVAVQKLRGKDPLTLELLVTEMMVRPLGQISVLNVADLFALNESSQVPYDLEPRLRRFCARMVTEIADLPNGSVFAAFVKGIADCEQGRIPKALRTVMSDEASKPSRGASERSLVAELEQLWLDAVPLEFEVGDRSMAPVVVKTEEKAPGTRTPRGSRSTKGSTSGRTRSASRASETTSRRVVVSDPARDAWTEQTCIERLASAKSKGLLEAVVMAGVKRRAKGSYPDLSNEDVKAALRRLERAGTVRTSAGRWIIGRVGW